MRALGIHINSVWKFVQKKIKNLEFPFVASNQASSLVWSHQLPVTLSPGHEARMVSDSGQRCCDAGHPSPGPEGIRKKWAMQCIISCNFPG